MANRPKRYGTDREREELSRSRYSHSERERLERSKNAIGGGRASEAQIWEREESLDDEDSERDPGTLSDR